MSSSPPILDYARDSRRALSHRPAPAAAPPTRRRRKRQPVRRALYASILTCISCGPLAGATVAAWEVAKREDALLFTAGLAGVAFICIAVGVSLPIDDDDVES